MSRRLPLLLILLALAPHGAQAEERVLETRYRVSLIGLPVGRAIFETRLTDETYSVAGSLESTGLADILASTKGTSSSAGRIDETGARPGRYSLAYTSGDESFSSEVRMRDGAVTSADVAPPRDDPAPDDFVAVTPGDLAGVFDPLGGVMIRADAAEVCNRTLRLYDGWTRLDLKLSPAGTKRFQADGFTADAIVCDLKLEPVAGYRRGSNGLKFLRDRTLKLWFAAIPGTDMFAPVHARIPTEIGPLTLTATVFARG